jgi:hypothetical protein
LVNEIKEELKMSFFFSSSITLKSGSFESKGSPSSARRRKQRSSTSQAATRPLRIAMVEITLEENCMVASCSVRMKVIVSQVDAFHILIKTSKDEA